MPFSEIIGMAKRKVDVTHQKPYCPSTDNSFGGGDNDSSELVWRNGEIAVQAQSSRPRNGPNDCPTFISKPQHGNDMNNSKMAKFSTTDYMLNDFPLFAPSSEVDLDEDDHAVPLLNRPIAEPFNNEYHSEECFHALEFAGNEFINSASLENTNKSNHVSEFALSNAAAIVPILKQESTSEPPFTVADLNKHRISERRNSEKSHCDTASATSRGGIQVKMSDENKGSTVDSHNQVEPTLVKCSHQESGSYFKLHVPQSAVGIESRIPAPNSLAPRQSEALFLKHGKSGRSLDGPFDSTVPTYKVVAGDEKIPDPQTSSVCPASSSERASNDPACGWKRRCHETETSEGPSDEDEEESVGITKTASNYTGSKRRRAYGVHNSSERRRGDRINEKMRALQELIPNCNKVDKASLLDEAMKYLQTLQLQWQILSMGTGMYMSPMMLQATMQQALRANYMPQFFPMGMHDANYSMATMNNQGPCYPVVGHPISTPMLHGEFGYSHQSAGYPGQQLLMSMPCVPFPIFGNVAGMPNTFMNDKSNQVSAGLEFDWTTNK